MASLDARDRISTQKADIQRTNVHMHLPMAKLLRSINVVWYEKKPKGTDWLMAIWMAIFTTLLSFHHDELFPTTLTTDNSR